MSTFLRWFFGAVTLVPITFAAGWWAYLHLAFIGKFALLFVPLAALSIYFDKDT